MPAPLATYHGLRLAAVAESGPPMVVPLDNLDSLSLAEKIRESLKARRKGPKKR